MNFNANEIKKWKINFKANEIKNENEFQSK